MPSAAQLIIVEIIAIALYVGLIQCFRKKKVVSPPPPRSRRVTVFQAVSDLARVGLRISELECHPETLSEIVEECMTLSVVHSRVLPMAMKASHDLVYYDIPLKQNATLLPVLLSRRPSDEKSTRVIPK
jgi:hypothetical protein